MQPQKSRRSKRRVVVNVRSNFYLDTKYDIVKYVAGKLLGWKLSNLTDDNSWDIQWDDTYVTPERLQKMKPYQKINHFPGMSGITRKNNLSLNLGKMRKKFPDEYDFYPQTWNLPSEWQDLKLHLQQKKVQNVIMKPEASCQGRGIYIASSVQQIDQTLHYIAQEYIDNPLLIDSLKFDLRLYVLVTGTDPLRIFIFEEGIARFATEEYQKPSNTNLEDACMHLTNYAINKHNEKFMQPETQYDDLGHKRSLSNILEYLDDQGYDIDELWTQICDIVIKTLCCIQPSIGHTYRSSQPDDITNAMCFEILGFDILLDENIRPWLLEVNHSPSFSTDSPLDKALKRDVIYEAMILLDKKPIDRFAYQQWNQKMVRQRTLARKTFKENQEDKLRQKEEIKQRRDKYEEEKAEGFIKIYPCEDADFYDQFINGAREIWSQFTGSRPTIRDKIIRKSVMTEKSQKVDKLPIIQNGSTGLLQQFSQLGKQYAPYIQTIKVKDTKRSASVKQLVDRSMNHTVNYRKFGEISG